MPFSHNSFPLHRAPLRVRRELVLGVIALAALAGFVNAVLLSFYRIPVSHMSGDVSRLGVDFAAHQLADIRLIGGIVGGFLTGAIISGAIIGRDRLVPGRRHAVVLVLEGCTLLVATLLLSRGNLSGIAAAAAACGLQNAMASSYYGLVIRTTHVTGVVTDIGVLIGQYLRYGRVQGWKLLFLSGILVAFFTGGGVGALMMEHVGVASLAMAGVVALLAGGGYLLIHERSRWRRASATQMPRPSRAA